MAEETMPIFRATARSDRPAALSVASCRWPITMIIATPARPEAGRGRASGFQPAVHGETGEQVPDLARDPLEDLLVFLERGADRLVHPGGDLRHVLLAQP